MALTYDTPKLVTANNSWSSVVTAANTNRDGTGTLNEIWQAGANGSHLHGIRFVSHGANANVTLARLFLFDGTNYKFWREKDLPITTNSLTVAEPEQYLPIETRIEADWKVFFVLATAVSAGWSAIGEAEDL